MAHLTIPENISELLTYAPDTGILTWTRRVSSRVRRGDAAGFVNGCGYVVIKINGQQYSAHRIAWYFIYGEQPPDLIDHRDGDKTNNARDNLRAADPSLNGANRRRYGRWKKGVQRVKNRFQAQIGYGGTTHYLGSFKTEEEAHQAYLRKATELFGEFARAA